MLEVKKKIQKKFAYCALLDWKNGFTSYRTIKKPFWTIKQEGCLSSISIDLTSTLQVQELKESVQYKVPILLAYKNTLNSLFFKKNILKILLSSVWQRRFNQFLHMSPNSVLPVFKKTM